ncbi:MAG: hypothetical protein EOO77_32210 [Oxalobacteraceae bacterium]|jgi:phage baseplate assembly protein W|nr:MAG: hypothetical protein EOO77_32210 [Oxalobacteraceae bacterium]
MTDRTFVGFSTVGASDSRSWALYDRDLIKQDLRNHFHTRKGERRMRPTYGCSIWDYIGEQMSADINESIRLEAERIVELDTRLEAENIYVDAKDHTIVLVMDLIYRLDGTAERFKIIFDARQ